MDCATLLPAVAMGTRFATTEESPLANQIKGAVLNPKPDGGATEADTPYRKNFDDITARVMRSPVGVRLEWRNCYGVLCTQV